jgi:hypothetical protein
MRANIGPGIAAQYGEGQARRTSDKPIRETSVSMFIEIQGVWPIMFDGVAKTVEGTHSGITAPRKNQLSSATRADQLVAYQIGRQSHQREITTSLPNYFVARGERDQMGEPLERDHVAIMNVRRDSRLQR